MQADPPALALRVVVLDPHGDGGADPGEGEGHDADQRTVAQPDDRGGKSDATGRLATTVSFCVFKQCALPRSCALSRDGNSLRYAAR